MSDTTGICILVYISAKVVIAYFMPDRPETLNLSVFILQDAFISLDISVKHLCSRPLFELSGQWRISFSYLFISIAGQKIVKALKR
jgi:hypothetical protein